MNKKFIQSLLFAGLIGTMPYASAGYITGGDAADQASATAILDIVFAIDTSASMGDEIATLTSTMGNIVANLDCPDIDCWVRARFFGITGTSGTLFNETVVGYVNSLGETPVTNHIEDNGPAVTDLANWYAWNDDSTADQDYYKAIVTIGDEGTENGYPSNQADWDAAYVANQAASSADIFLFSIVGTPWPSYVSNQPHRDAVFEAMAVGGSGGGYTFDNTGGGFYSSTSQTLELDIEEIICTAASGGTDPRPVSEPGLLLMFFPGLLGLLLAHRRKSLV